MTIPDKVQCPICKNMMSDLSKENPTLNISDLSFVINGKRIHSECTIFICGECHNIQTFLDMKDKPFQ